MIRIKQPSLVVYSHDVPGYKYQMKWTWKMLPGATAGDIVNWVLHLTVSRDRLPPIGQFSSLPV